MARRASLSDSQSKAFDEVPNFRGSWVDVGRRGKDLKMVDIGERGRTERTEERAFGLSRHHEGPLVYAIVIAPETMTVGTEDGGTITVMGRRGAVKYLGWEASAGACANNGGMV